MAADKDFSVRFWGVRGSIACPGPDTLKYGGNTPCLEIRCGTRRLIFDAGTGIRELGRRLIDENDLDLFLSHTHFDHISGLPFFSFLFDAANQCRLWAGHLTPERTIEEVLRQMMRSPLFPVPLDIFKADLVFRDFTVGTTLEIGDGIRLRTAPLNHPDRATGYRVEYDGRSICYLTDTEHVPGQPDQNILDLIDGADLVIYDAMFTDVEFHNFVQWGHSTWQEGARLCQAAGAKTLILFHHLPGRDDRALDTIAAEAAKAFPGALVAREGMTLTP